ncbi:proteinaceous RNase P 1, chloroplastic/mitochondrial isoform X1 [Cannabis sativa]|uniref:proteinaceous RNase P 1, chloroplastic/mitochondrial isoform X1 n=1 Tax=Cannabis sativa TaxID=3483 RepID=UPI0029C9EA72|nr:proteinaceous RNase P 1, chloroplastic/mitochondrial isoform X1 [Cannabis sativa]
MASASSSSFTFNSLHQKHHTLPLNFCKYPSTLHVFKFHYSSRFLIFSPLKHITHLSQLLLFKDNVRHVVAKLNATDQKPYTKTTIHSRTVKRNSNGVSHLRSIDDDVDKVGKNSGKKYVNLEEKTENNFNKPKNRRRNQGLRKVRELNGGNSSVKSRDKDSKVGSVKSGKQVGEEKGKKSRKSKEEDTTLEVPIRPKLDMCSKRGDVMSAIQLFDLAQREGIKLGQYHYTVLLYLCSSAAVGIVRPAKSGSASRTLDTMDSSGEVSASSSLDLAKSRDLDGNTSGSDGVVESDELSSSNRLDDSDGNFNEREKLNWFCNGFVKRNYRVLDGLSHPTEGEDENAHVKGGSKNKEDKNIWVDEEAKQYARKRGFEIYEKMCSENIPMNEAALTSVARMAMSMGNGDMAFDMVKQMKSLGINPRLRSYGPALSAFSSSGEIDKAFAVEQHMLEHGVYPEEPELQALLRVSVGVGKGDKVYYLLHKLRASVRKVSPSTADLIINWFNSIAASRVGKTKWDERQIKKAIESGGGGWHGQGWLGRGKWSVLQTSIGADGLCRCCGEKLVTIDLDPKETENFAESVASIAIEKEKHSNFQKFQKWLDYYGPFEAVIDGANVGLFSQKIFRPSKINAVANGIRQKFPSKKWPLIVLHNRRVTGPKMNEPTNRAFVDRWKNADALYATPTGSNDDWYWLYAAIKFKSLLVTNDEMRDHTFQLLGNDFFPRWKERHQVRFTFSDAGPEFHMPPPCSVVIQESEKGHWHIPISTEHEYEEERPWLCIMRAKSRKIREDNKIKQKALQSEIKSKSLTNGKDKDKHTNGDPMKIYQNLKDILAGSTIANSQSILAKIEQAEKLGRCTIDFDI